MALISNNVSGEKDLNELWHRKMGNLHHGVLRIHKETVMGVLVLTTKHDYTCRGCILGNYVKVAYSRSTNIAQSVLGLIHSYIYGPMSIRSINGVEQFVTFIDDHSRKTWIYFLKNKDKVFDWLRSLRLWWKT